MSFEDTFSEGRPRRVHEVWDKISGLSIHHLTFVLEHFLPRWSKEFLGTVTDSRCIIRANIEARTFNDVDIIEVGNCVEKLSVPESFRKGSEAAMNTALSLQAGDIIQMIVSKYAIVATAKKPGPQQYTPCEDFIQPGYLKLTCHDPNNDWDYIVKKYDHYYVSSARYEKHVLGHYAASLHLQQIKSEESCEINSMTLVAMKVNHWPAIAVPWITRHRNSGWPPVAVRRTIVEGGVHVLPCAHASSEGLDWQYYFGMAMVKLSHVLSEVERQCFIIVKAILTRNTDVPLYISRCLQHIFFWMLESFPSHHREDSSTTLASMILIYLNDVVSCFSKKTVPNFFMPQQNLLCGIEHQDITNMEVAARNFRQAPIQCVLDFSARIRFNFSPQHMDFKKIFTWAIEDAIKYHEKVGKCCYMSQLEGLYGLCIAYLCDHEIDGAIATSKAIADVNWKIRGVKRTFQEILEALAMQVKPVIAIMANETLLQKLPECNGGFHNNLGILNQHMAYSKDHKHCNTFQDRAEMHFIQARTKCPERLTYQVDYSAFLRRCGRHAHAISILSELVENRKDDKDDTAYYRRVAAGVDSNIKSELNRGSLARITVPSITAAYYQLIQCYLETEQTSNAFDLLGSFSKICERYSDNPHVFSFLGYAHKSAGNDTLGDDAFTRATAIAIM